MIAVIDLVGKQVGKLTGELAEHAQTDQHQVSSVVEILLARRKIRSNLST